MGRKVGLDTEAITSAAVELVTESGLEAATLSSVAARLGVKVPSLYNHLAGLAGLRRLITLHAVERLTEVLQAAIDQDEPGKSTDARQALAMMAAAYRRFATEHPGLYRSLLPAPTPGEDDELYQAMARPVALIVSLLGPLGPGDDATAPIHQVRALRSLIHGFVDLEIQGGFGMPIDTDTSFERAVEHFIAGLPR